MRFREDLSYFKPVPRPCLDMQNGNQFHHPRRSFQPPGQAIHSASDDGAAWARVLARAAADLGGGKAGAGQRRDRLEGARDDDVLHALFDLRSVAINES